jgi:hypothetical protein
MTPHVARLRRRAAIPVLLLAIAGCSTWAAQPLATPSTLRLDPAKPVRVVRADGNTTTLSGARISGDTLYGVPVTKAAGESVVTIAIPFAEVRKLEVEKTDTTRIVLIVLGMVGLSLLFSD